jgi:O-antigen ligase
MGGGPYYLMLKERGYIDFSDTSIFAYLAPMNVTTEVLAGLGLVGAIGFGYFFYLLFRMFRRTLRLSLSVEERRTLIALALSLCVCFATLQFNQSIMRAYLWIHTGIFCGYARALQHKWLAVKDKLG